jgi:hypothetical protein
MKIIQSWKMFKFQNCSDEKKVQIKNLQILNVVHILKKCSEFNQKEKKNTERGKST